MKKGWKEDKLKDLCKEIFSGGTPDTRKPEYWDGELNWLSSGETRNKFIKNTEKTITQEGVKNSSTRLALKNDLVMACAGQGHTRGQVSICLIDTYVNQSIITMRTNNKVLSQYFLFYHLSSKYQFLRDLSASNSIRGSITCPMLGNLDINHPEIDEQQKIATTLSNYDDLIENNTKRIKLLEKIAKLIYEEWFVKFKFPGHEKVKFFDSELGKIPEEWEVKKLGDICSKVTDGTHEVVKETNRGYHMVSAKDIGNGFVDFSRTHFISEDDHEKIMKRSKPEKGDILFSKIGTIGNIAIVSQDFEFSIKNVALFKISNKIHTNLLYCYLRNENNLNQLIAKASGTSQKFFSLNFLQNLNLIVPSDVILEKFDKFITPILFKRLNLYNKNQNLSKTRDLLLPRLITGKVDVSELDIQVEVEA